MNYKAPVNIAKKSSSKYDKHIQAFLNIPQGQVLHLAQDEEELELERILAALRNYCGRTKRPITIRTVRDEDKNILEAYVANQIYFPKM